MMDFYRNSLKEFYDYHFATIEHYCKMELNGLSNEKIKKRVRRESQGNGMLKIERFFIDGHCFLEVLPKMHDNWRPNEIANLNGFEYIYTSYKDKE